MGSYEDEYKKYYSDIKAKIKVKSNNKKESILKKEDMNINSSMDIYPKSNRNINIYDNKEEKHSNLIIDKDELKTYKEVGTYSGISNYNTLNSNKSNSRYSRDSYYGYNSKNNSEQNAEENLLGKWGNRIIFKLVITIVLFISIIGLKILPYEETKAVYTMCKEIVSKDFDYKNFIEDVKTINIIDEMEKVKESLKTNDPVGIYKQDNSKEDISTFNTNNNDENVDEIIVEEETSN